MQLQTLRELALPGSVLERPKPLLLLCYLALEGPKERRFLSELFWPTSEKSLASLSTTLYRINHEAPEAIQSDELRVWTQLKTDTQLLLSSIQQETFDPSLYTGAFLQGFYVADISEELNEWILQTREGLALKVQKTLLKQAERMAALGQFAEAAERTEIILKLPGAADLEPEDLLRCYPLLLATEHPLASTVEKQLADYNIKSNLNSQEARSRLRQVFVGRSREIETLSALDPGQWAWLKGGTGLGKTSLLQQLPGRYLSGQAGLPYATLEPLVGEAVQNGAEAVLRRLSRQEGFIKLDNWEQTDPESQDIFKRLKTLRADCKIVISSSQSPPFMVDKILELSPLSNQDLENDLWKRTGGVPNLVSAYMRGEPLPQALATTLHHLSETARHLYLSLALLEEPDVGLVRRGLKLSASDLAKALEDVIGAGLAQVSGRVWPREVAREYLQNQPSLRAHLALSLARQLQPKQAIHLYQTAKDLWEEQDFEAVKEAYIHHAKGLLERGFPQKAVELLSEAPRDDETTFWKAYALERTCTYNEAFETIKGLPETPHQVKALKSVLYFRLGKPIEAKKLANQALKGDSWAKAQAYNTLGEIAHSQGDYEKAIQYGQRATMLWKLQGDSDKVASSLNSIAVDLFWQGKPLAIVESAYQEALDASKDNPRQRVNILGNLSVAWERFGEFERAIESYNQTINLAENLNLVSIASKAWNNLGVLYHYQNQKVEAKRCYENSISHARKADEKGALGNTLANLAELNEDFEAWQEALGFLRSIGQEGMAQSIEANLSPDHPFYKSSS